MIWLQAYNTTWNGVHRALWAIKTCHFILDHNSRVSGWISTFCAPIKTGKKTLSGNYKICEVPTTVCLHLRKFKNTKQHDHGRPPPALRSTKPVVRSSIPILVRIFPWQSSNRKSFTFPQVLIKILSSKLNIRPIIHLHSKHSGRAMWRNYDVITDK